MLRRLLSGTILFTSCDMRCAFCQNGDISTDKDNGEVVEARRLATMAQLLRLEGSHNVNWAVSASFSPVGCRPLRVSGRSRQKATVTPSLLGEIGDRPRAPFSIVRSDRLKLRSMRSDLTQLSKRVRAATGRDNDLDRSIAELLDHGAAEVPAYTGSVDACIDLVHRVLPGWSWHVGYGPRGVVPYAAVTW